mmetsp:Transcript_66805/g.204518  ORF Transcript_66805/g.204518 Transcript_66805/m.204518 type:complete len:242 (-) Transcript_66805:556-1281(-)
MYAKTALKPVGDWTASNTRGVDNLELTSKATSLVAMSQKMLVTTNTPRTEHIRGSSTPGRALATTNVISNTAAATCHPMIARRVSLIRATGKRNTSPNSPMRSNAVECNLIVFQLASTAVTTIENTCNATCAWLLTSEPSEHDSSKSTLVHTMPHFKATRVRKCRSIGTNRKNKAPSQLARSRHRSVNKLASPTTMARQDMATVMIRLVLTSTTVVRHIALSNSSPDSIVKCVYMRDHNGP